MVETEWSKVSGQHCVVETQWSKHSSQNCVVETQWSKLCGRIIVVETVFRLPGRKEASTIWLKVVSTMRSRRRFDYV